MKNTKLIGLTTLSLLTSIAYANQDNFKIHIESFPDNAKNTFAISQAGHDTPSLNPGNQNASFDILAPFAKATADATIPVLPQQKELAKSEFDVALIYETHTDLGKRYLLIDCPNMIADKTNQAVPYKVTDKESKFIANEALASLKGVMTNDMYQKSQTYLTTAIQNFVTHKVDVRVCNNDQGGIFDVNAPVSNDMSKELFAQIGKLAKEWWYA